VFISPRRGALFHARSPPPSIPDKGSVTAASPVFSEIMGRAALPTFPASDNVCTSSLSASGSTLIKSTVGASAHRIRRSAARL
jgi:hypothetical protein